MTPRASSREHRIRTPLVAVVSCALLILVGCAAADRDAGRAMGTVGDAGKPVLVVAYTPNTTIRLAFEEQLERDLGARGILALPSLRVTPDFSRLTHGSVLRAATDADASMVLMVRRVIVPGDPARMSESNTAVPTQRHRSLRDYVTFVSRDRIPDVPPSGRQVIEVAGYLLREDGAGDAELAWNGVTWVDFDGDLEAAIADTADIIATNMAAARDRMRESR